MSILYKSYNDLGALVLRLGAAGFMIPHGYHKLQGLMAGDTSFADPIGVGEFPSLLLAIFAELICAILVLVGLQTRLATIPLMVTMAVAALIVHADDPFHKQEFPLLYFVAYLALFFMGSGRFSLDTLFGRK